jgi:hypothetical protein
MIDYSPKGIEFQMVLRRTRATAAAEVAAAAKAAVPKSYIMSTAVLACQKVDQIPARETSLVLETGAPIFQPAEVAVVPHVSNENTTERTQDKVLVQSVWFMVLWICGLLVFFLKAIPRGGDFVECDPRIGEQLCDLGHMYGSFSVETAVATLVAVSLDKMLPDHTWPRMLYIISMVLYTGGQVADLAKVTNLLIIAIVYAMFVSSVFLVPRLTELKISRGTKQLCVLMVLVVFLAICFGLFNNALKPTSTMNLDVQGLRHINRAYACIATKTVKHHASRAQAMTYDNFVLAVTLLRNASGILPSLREQWPTVESLLVEASTDLAQLKQRFDTTFELEPDRLFSLKWGPDSLANDCIFGFIAACLVDKTCPMAL